jgi:hypothetical protein
MITQCYITADSVSSPGHAINKMKIQQISDFNLIHVCQHHKLFCDILFLFSNNLLI